VAGLFRIETGRADLDRVEAIVRKIFAGLELTSSSGSGVRPFTGWRKSEEIEGMARIYQRRPQGQAECLWTSSGERAFLGAKTKGTPMKRLIATALLTLAAACTPATPGPEAVVLKIYQPLADSKGTETTSLAGMPLSEELAALVSRAEAAGAARDEPVFDGDFAGNCQDCAGFSDLRITAGPAGALAAGHKSVEASFKLYHDVSRTVTWDMVQTPDGWRVDNVVSDGIDLRRIALEAIDAGPVPPQPPAPPQ
jgi:hypothetical protein